MIVVETAKMNESELAEYAHQKGLFVEQIKAWKDACLQANGGVAKETAELNKKLSQSAIGSLISVIAPTIPVCRLVKSFLLLQSRIMEKETTCSASVSP